MNSQNRWPAFLFSSRVYFCASPVFEVDSGFCRFNRGHCCRPYISSSHWKFSCAQERSIRLHPCATRCHRTFNKTHTPRKSGSGSGFPKTNSNEYANDAKQTRIPSTHPKSAKGFRIIDSPSRHGSSGMPENKCSFTFTLGCFWCGCDWAGASWRETQRQQRVTPVPYTHPEQTLWASKERRAGVLPSISTLCTQRPIDGSMSRLVGVRVKHLGIGHAHQRAQRTSKPKRSPRGI